MRVLYAIQGTGNGHLARAKEIIPALMNRVRVDVLISGTETDIELPFPVKYRLKGISFVFGKNGGIDYFKTINKINIFRIIKEIKSCRVKDYDLVINDFEPISAWACYFRNSINCIALSHQNALLQKAVPKPKRHSVLGSLILRNYAPATVGYGFHFKNYGKNIFPAIIRDEIRKQNVKEKNYYVVYLPSYSDEKIIKVLSKFKKENWKIYSKHASESYLFKNIEVKPIGNSSFERSMAHCKGIICGAGFETPAEALYLKKKLLVIPMQGQYEQAYNAESLKQIGVTVLTGLNKAVLPNLKQWLVSKNNVDVNFPDKTQFIVDEIISNHIIATELSNKILQNL